VYNKREEKKKKNDAGDRWIDVRTEKTSIPSSTHPVRKRREKKRRRDKTPAKTINNNNNNS
jgi:hypothetical protein